jgi:hypothetical protein
MNLLTLPIGSIIVSCCIGTVEPPAGWRDITGTLECIETIESGRLKFPDANMFIERDTLFCIKKVQQDVTS